MKAKKTKAKSKTLKQIGLWATIWWGVSGLYVLLWVWLSRSNFVNLSQSPRPDNALSRWQAAMSRTYQEKWILSALLAAIIIVWAIGGWVWLKELKRRKISYKAAFKDLFLTIR